MLHCVYTIRSHASWTAEGRAGRAVQRVSELGRVRALLRPGKSIGRGGGGAAALTRRVRVVGVAGKHDWWFRHTGRDE